MRGHLYFPSSVARALECVRGFFRWRVATGDQLVDPTRYLVVRRTKVLHRLLTEAEVTALLAAPSSHTVIGRRDRAILETFYGTGIRRFECHRLDLDDLDLTEDTLRVRHGKGGRSRILPVTNTLPRSPG